MADKVALLLGVHAHQPAGNFPEVVAKAHALCYRPFLQTLHRYPQFRFALHASGPLLDTLFERYPDDMRVLREMVGRGQVELFGAGDTEPVLAAIPERDRVTQIRALAAKLERALGQRPEGAWLSERVWEPTVVPALAGCGIRYVTVDDYHFLCAGKTDADLGGYFTTEEGGEPLDLFPISEPLRYRIPFAPAPEVVAYIETLAERGAGAAAIYFDDIEKFGIWPETHEWVYGKDWLEAFIRGVLASTRIETLTYREFHAAHRTRGIVYLPTTSYIEMNEWTLPAPVAHAYAGLVAREKEAGRYGVEKAFLRGGIWRNFLSRYPEANWMHKRMLALSARLAALEPRQRTPEMQHLLHLAQANDAYWHGLFGGLYLPHLRRGVYNALLRLEAALDQLAPRPVRTRIDLDADGVDEVFLQNGELQAVVRLDGAASVVELDSYALAQNFGDTLRRHAEPYHRRALEAGCSRHRGEGVASAHDRATFKHEIRPEDLVTDVQGRTIFRDWWVDAGGAEHPIDGYVPQPREGVEHAVRFRAPCRGGAVDKQILVQGSRITAWYSLAGLPGGRLRTELNLALPSCDGYAGRYVLRGDMPCGFGQPLDAEGVTELILDDRFMRGSVGILTSRPARARARPLHTVSQSEDGFEKVMQCAVIELEWPVGAGTAEVSVTLKVTADT
ncbi:MAG TPA: alpha-amylase/4-alpha-glucanotransferase domain-containing protein [Burkholderiales bacterium]|nr:alpha-amylase/4-alpha-glucanotransferase domain-containing protein [Burkholderiales bacterium]